MSRSLVTLRRRALLALPAAALLPGCAEPLLPEPEAALPAAAVPEEADPLRFAVETAARRMVDQAALLRGQPGEAAFACAMVEYATTGFQDGTYGEGPWLTRLLREGRTALRSTLQLYQGATPQAAVDALLAAAEDFRRGEPQASVLSLVPLTRLGSWPSLTLSELDPPGPLRRALREARRVVAAGSAATA